MSVVYPEPTVTLNATPGTVTPGAEAKLTWTTADANDCAASGAWNGKKALAGDEMTAPLASQSAFSLSCSGPGGSVDATVTVKVQDAPSASDTMTVTATKQGGGGAWTGGTCWRCSPYWLCVERQIAHDEWSGRSGSPAGLILRQEFDLLLCARGSHATPRATLAPIRQTLRGRCDRVSQHAHGSGCTAELFHAISAFDTDFASPWASI